MRDRWNALCERTGAFGKVEEADLTFEMIHTLYTHPPRAYHNLDHIAQCLAVFDGVRMLAEDKDAVEFALWLHDSVFFPERPDNEARSADAAGTVAGLLGCRAEFADRVRTLIHATRHSEPPEPGDTALVADIDLSILAADDAAYDAYSRAIHDEFSFAGEQMFRDGRRAFLRRMLDRDRIFATRYFRKEMEGRARGNMERELGEMANGT
jgi:predicted metal-dependent HD superfamily phosphohydrolase